MSEHMNPIPSRLYNAAVGGHVCGAVDIIDDTLGIEQSSINEDVAPMPYNDGNPNGMGRIILKKTDNFKNVVEAQSGNTIFVIKYDFTLTDNVTVPANCVLNFDGGSISGAYTITGANTGIEASLVKIFNTNITLAGTWNVVEAYPEWFGAKGDGVTDDSIAIQKALFFKIVRLQNKIYGVSSSIDITFDKKLIGDSSEYPYTPVLEDVDLVKKGGIKALSVLDYVLKISKWNISIEGVVIDCDEKAKVGIFSEESSVTKQTRINIIDCYIRKPTEYGISVYCYYSTFRNIVVLGADASTTYGFNFKGSAARTSLVIERCYAKECLYGFFLLGLTYSNMISCACDNCTYAYYIRQSEMNMFGCGCEFCDNPYTFKYANNIEILTPVIYPNANTTLFTFDAAVGRYTIKGVTTTGDYAKLIEGYCREINKQDGNQIILKTDISNLGIASSIILIPDYGTNLIDTSNIDVHHYSGSSDINYSLKSNGMIFISSATIAGSASALQFGSISLSPGEYLIIGDYTSSRKFYLSRDSYGNNNFKSIIQSYGRVSVTETTQLYVGISFTANQTIENILINPQMYKIS